MIKPLRGLWKLTWLEIKIFAREPMGLVGSLVMPVVVFIALGRLLSGLPSSVGTRPQGFLQTGLPVLAAIMIAVNGIISLVTIISIYREGGILKRLRATPLSPATILTAHVIVKLAFTALTLALLLLVGKRYYPVDVDPPLLSFTVALLLSTWSLLSIGFLIASVVPTARFAQPIAGLVLYPLLGTVRALRRHHRVPAGAGTGGETQPVHVRRVAAAGHLARRALVRAPDRRRRPGRGLRGADRRVVARVPVAVSTPSILVPSAIRRLRRSRRLRNYADSELRAVRQSAPAAAPVSNCSDRRGSWIDRVRLNAPEGPAGAFNRTRIDP